MYQFIKALSYLHSIGICHRDIKPHNLLIDIDKKMLKLCDFGCSKRLIEGEPNINYICARFYRAPEIVFGWTHYSCSIDMWSAGCVMAELFMGKPIFPGINSMDQLAKIIKILGAPTSSDLRAMGQTSGPVKKPRQASTTNNSNTFPFSTNNNNNNNNGCSDASINNGSATLREFIRAYNKEVPEQGLDLIDRLLRYDPSVRLTAKEALEHPFFDSLKFEDGNSGNGINSTVNASGVGSSSTPRRGNDSSDSGSVYRATFQPS